MTQPSAKVIADNIYGNARITTLEVVMHRFVLAEFNTHRAFSRNSASSRAIPYDKFRNKVVAHPAMPVIWASEQKGMQGGDAVSDPALVKNINNTWRSARDSMVYCADLLHEFGVHKSLVNRLLEPFMWHTAIVTATDWDNFFSQRCSPLAQPEIKATADAMQLAYYKSTPTIKGYGQWHLPYIGDQDIQEVTEAYRGLPYAETTLKLAQISTARCARVSYLTHTGKRDFTEDLNLYDRLLTHNHWSPFEHPARATRNDQYFGNFRAWEQYRKSFAKENVTDFVPNLPELETQRERILKGYNPWDSKGDEPNA